MSKKNERTIKLTSDGRFHAMGLVVDTFDEAFSRCLEKTKASPDDWCTLVLFENVSFKDCKEKEDREYSLSFYLPGNREYLRQCIAQSECHLPQ